MFVLNILRQKSFYEKLLLQHYLQHYSGTTIQLQRLNFVCGFLIKSAVIKCHQLRSKANRKLCSDQLTENMCGRQHLWCQLLFHHLYHCNCTIHIFHTNFLNGIGLQLHKLCQLKSFNFMTVYDKMQNNMTGIFSSV